MKRKLWWAVIFSVIFVLCTVPAVITNAAVQSETESASWQTCTVYAGDNVEDQNYSVWSKPMYSYLTPCEDGRLMRVQGNTKAGGILVEYYDENYNLKETKIIKNELSIFGGFYATDSNYFLLTGQNNIDELADVEVYRITKYDKEWNRIDSAGLYDCNTTYPFDAGSARMDVCGDYLLIRTSHEMYTSSDGYNHQANVTIQLNMNTMEITDSFTKVADSSCGYVSHSFNQFIKIDENHIVAVDHGDAYPRAIALLKYPTDVSAGKFTPSYYNPCTLKNVMTFPGNTGNNATGASSCTWISDTTGKKKLYVDVKDSEGTVATKSMDYEIISNGLSENSFDFCPETNLVYDGEEKSAAVSGKEGIAEGLGTVTVKYYDADGTLIEGKPIYAGTYTVKIDLSEGEIYGIEKDLTYPS